jgi:alkanesulfonate monooxygenase SsuD/methylene tetrahydromethanopterin reductase-like flavin-dependent oxidoreductase (luciferase family)
MSQLTGEAAEGVLFNWQTPESSTTSGRIILDAAEAAGRPRPLLMAYVRCALLPQAGERLEVEAARYGRVPSYADHFARMGVSARDTAVCGVDSAALQAGIAAHEPVLDETVVRAITADDSAPSILELLRACAPS